MIVEEEQQGRRLDDRLAGQLAAMTAEARTRLAATPVPVVASGCAALAVLALCPFFGFTISLSQVGSSSFATSIVLTASTGVALLFGGSFAIFYQVQHSRLKQFGRGVVTSIEPLLPRAPSPIPPVVTWPSARAAGVRNILILVAAGVATASLSGLFLSLLYG